MLGHFVLLLDEPPEDRLVAALFERCPDAVVSHFVHIPWPGPDAWRVLPTDMRERLLRGLLGCYLPVTLPRCHPVIRFRLGAPRASQP